MTSTDFEQSNKVFVAPDGMSDCGNLPVWKGMYGGQHVLVSAWQPTDDEIARILVGEPVYLLVVGHGQPPVSLFAGKDTLKHVIPS